MLLKRGADIAAGRDTNETMLHSAVEEDREEMLKLLINCGLDVEACDPRGTPSDYAMALCRTQI